MLCAEKGKQQAAVLKHKQYVFDFELAAECSCRDSRRPVADDDLLWWQLMPTQSVQSQTTVHRSHS